MTTSVRIAYLLSHPIQYQSVMLRELADSDEFDITVFYGLDTVSEGSFDAEFGQHVKWDVPLLEGYQYEFLPTLLSAKVPGNLRPINRGLRSRLKNGRFDLLWLHGWGRLADLLAIRDARALGIPILMRTENNFRGTARPRPGLLQGLKESIKHRVMRQCDVFGYMGQAGYDYFRAYRVASQKLFDMPYLVDNHWWQEACSNVDVSEFRQTWQLKDDRPVVLYVGKLIARKGLIELLQAYTKLPADTRPYLLIVGSGPMEKQAHELAKDLPHVRFAGFRNQAELPAFFTASDLFVIPSKDEQWGVVVNEAMNGGCAILASDEVGSAPELVIEGKTGYLYPAGDTSKLENALNTALADPAQLKQTGEHARKHIASYNASRIRDGLSAAIGELRRSGKIH